MASRREQAGLPTGPGMRAVVFELLKEMPNPVNREQIGAAVASRLALSDVQLAIREPRSGGGDSHRSFVGWQSEWACNNLKQIGVCEQPSRGLYQLTDWGRTISSDEIEKLHRKRVREQDAKRKQATAPSLSHAKSDEGSEDDWSRQMLDRLLRVTPRAFEHLAGSLLQAAGFDDVRVTGGSGDGGIDGIGVYRPAGLISFHTAFQCKRYQGSVGASTVRDFRGSFIGQADRGIIITTGSFTKSALDEAGKAGAPPVDLIDGATLCELLKQHRLGVRVIERTVEDVFIDDTYFAQFEDAE